MLLIVCLGIAGAFLLPIFLIGAAFEAAYERIPGFRAWLDSLGERVFR